MSRIHWHILHDGPVLTLARRLPVRFDLAVRTCLPEAGRLKVAHRVRQDLWRALQKLRGFAPVVRVERTGAGLEVTAGGQVAGAFCRAHAEGRIRSVLDDPCNRERWVR